MTPYNCEGPGKRIRLDNQPGDPRFPFWPVESWKPEWKSKFKPRY